MALALDGVGLEEEPPSRPGGARAILRLRGGEPLAVDLDRENAGYLRASFERRPGWFDARGRRRFAWFETTDELLIGVDLAAVVAIDWSAAAPDAPPADRHHLVLRFGDGQALRLEQIGADDIDRLRGATIAPRAGAPLRCAERTIAVETLVLATLPARWMDAEPG